MQVVVESSPKFGALIDDFVEMGTNAKGGEFSRG